MVGSSDFSVFALFTAGLAAVASAQNTKPVGDPSGNAILSPKLGDIVTAGTPWPIVWNPTSQGSVSLYLCIGPPSNCVNQPTPFANKIANSGSFSWTPDLSLAPGTTGYGIQLVVEDGPDAGKNQYTSQFGVKNSNPISSSVSASASASATASVSTYPCTDTVTVTKTALPVSTYTPSVATPKYPKGPSTVTQVAYPTGTGAGVYYSPSASPTPAPFTGGAQRAAAGLGAVVAAFAVLAL